MDNVDVVIADGGSTDGSVDPEILAPLGVHTVLVKTGQGKLGAQMRMAFDWALNQNYQGVIAMDGNDKDGPEAIPRFAVKLAEGYDHVQGSRFLPGGDSQNLPIARYLGLKVVHVPLIRWASTFHYTDTTNGFRAYSRKFLLSPRVDLFRDVFQGYELHYYLSIMAGKRGFRLCEIPVSRVYPDHGPIPSKINSVRGNLNLLQVLFWTCLGKFDSKEE